MLRLVIFAVMAASALSAALLDLDREWMIFQKTYNKLYSAEDESVRRIIWERNLKTIEEHNLEADRGLHTYRLGMNHLGDMTTKEVTMMLNGYKMSDNSTCGATYLPPSNVGDLPAEVDWRKKGYVTPVKNQGECGSCWAFSSTGSLEAQHFKKTGTLVSLSEQNLVDCSGPEGDAGCSGGWMDNAFKYIKINKGIDTEKSYPYEARNQKCQFTRAGVGATDTGFVSIPKGSEKTLQSAVATVGPVSIAIDASTKKFHLYKSGVFYDPSCNSETMDHAVLVVGYGTLGSKDYWIVKNSWGKSWGDNGYILMSRYRDNNCGIASHALYPLV